MAAAPTIDPRLAALSALRIMGSAPEERFDRITRLAQELFDVPRAEIHFLDETTQFTKSPQALGAALEHPRDDTLCDWTLKKRSTLVIPDLRVDPRFADKAYVRGDPNFRFYAGRPLSVDDGLQVGTICLLDVVPRDLSAEQAQLLDEFGGWVERELRSTAERDRAGELQGKLLPTAAVHPGGYALSGLSVPLGQVGGDFYNWRMTDDAIELTIADVMGKGAAAAILAAGIRSAFAARFGAPPASVVESVNQQLAEDFARTGTFATLLHARLDTATGRLEFIDSGHGLAVVVRAGGGSERLASRGLPIGITPDARWVAQAIHLREGDTLVAFTDGVLDLFDGTLASVDRVAELARTSADTPAFLDALRALAEGDRASDDVTALVVSRR